MKISIINHVYLDSDLCTTTQLSIIRSLKKLGHNVKFIVPLVKNGAFYGKDFIFIPTLSKHSLISSPVFNLILLFYLPIHIISNKPDYILLDYCTFIGAIPYMFLSKIKLVKSRFIFDVRSQPVESIGFVGKLRNLQYCAAMVTSKYLARGFTFLTSMMARAECKKFNINNKYIGIWESGVDEILFNNAKYKKNVVKLKKEFNLSNEFIFLYHGIITFNRGLQNLIKALAITNQTHKNIILFILGSGPAQKELEDIIGELHLENKVIIYGPVNHEDVPKYIAMSDVGIIPLPHHKDWINQHPIKLSEYLSMGKAVVVTDIPAHTSVIKNAKSGIYIKSNRPQDIAEAMKYSYKNKNKLLKLNNTSRNIILNNYTWDIIAKKLETFLYYVK